MNDVDRLSGRVMVVSGGSAGIGRAVVERSYAHGAAVIGLDVIPSGLRYEKGRYSYEWVDVTDRGRLSQIARCNPFVSDVIIAAGVTQSKSGEIDETEAARIHKINVGGAQNVFQAFQPELGRGANVVFVSSDTITQPTTDLPTYVASKRAMALYAQQQARLHPNLRILTLLPGPVDTQLFRANKDEERIRRIDQAVGIMSPDMFATVLVDIVLPNPDRFPTGSFVRITKSKIAEIVDPTTLSL